MRKFLPKILILLAIFAGVGFFGTAEKAGAVSGDGKGTCYENLVGGGVKEVPVQNQLECLGKNTNDPSTPTYSWEPADSNTGASAAENPLENNLKNCTAILHGDFNGCIEKIFYFLFYTIPAFLLGLSAQFFNALLAITLSSKLYSSSGFISTAWAVVRDLSNIFFILILLYIAIKIILGMGGHGVKEMIAKIIVMALLINFSMFFTGIVIDASNMLALVFYNKLNVVTKVDGKEVFNIPVTSQEKTGIEEREIAGAIVGKFDPSLFLSQKFFDDIKKKAAVVPAESISAKEAAVGTLIPIYGLYKLNNVIRGYFVPQGTEVPTSIILSVILISGTIMGFAAYVFFMAGFAFLSRLVELWVLIIFSPFAFMSSTIPLLGHTEYIGWDSWIKRLLTVSFMAPIFMFFMYFIFLLVNSNIFDLGAAAENQTITATMLLVIIPVAIILTLLIKAKDFAKKGSGKIGEALISGTKALAGLTVGLAAGSTALAGRATVGAFMKGASTGDTAANRIPSNLRRITDSRAIIADPHSNIADRTRARGEIARANMDLIKGRIQEAVGLNRAQNWVGERLNRDQHNVEHAKHARHDLDEAAGRIAHGKKWEQLNGEERYQVRRQIARDRVVRDNAGDAAIAPVTPGISRRFGNRKWADLTTAEREEVDRTALVGDDHGHAIAGLALDRHTTVADELINDARGKQGLISKTIQSTVSGTYDIRNLAEIVAQEQTTGFAKLAASLTGGVVKGMRGGLKQAGVGFGKAEGKFFKDLGNTISESLKNVKINVDLSHVGEVKKEDSHGGGGHGGGHH